MIKGNCLPKRQYVLSYHSRITVNRHEDSGKSGVGETLAMKLAEDKTNSVYKSYNIVSDADLKRAGGLLQRSRLKSRDIEQIQPIEKLVSG